MKLNILICSVFFMCFALNCAQEEDARKPQNDLTTYGLKGKVKSCKQTSFEAVDKFGNIQKGARTHSIGDFSFSDSYSLFNTFGYTTIRFEYKSDGSIISKVIKKYLPNRKLSQESEYNNEDKLAYKWIYKYMPNDNLLEESLYDSKGNLHSKTIHSYNEDNQLKTSTSYDQNGDLEDKIIFAYNEIGKLVEESRSNVDGSIIEKRTWEYSSDGKMRKSNNFDEAGKLVFQGNHDNTEKVVESYGYFYGIETKSHYQYDEKGNQIRKEEVSMGNTTIITYEYTYDQHQNWIKRIEYLNGIPKYLVERKIEYYP